MVVTITLRVRNILIRVTFSAMVAVVRVVLMCIAADGHRSDEEEHGSSCHHFASKTVSLLRISERRAYGTGIRIRILLNGSLLVPYPLTSLSPHAPYPLLPYPLVPELVPYKYPRTDAR